MLCAQKTVCSPACLPACLNSYFQLSYCSDGLPTFALSTSHPASQARFLARHVTMLPMLLALIDTAGPHPHMHHSCRQTFEAAKAHPARSILQLQACILGGDDFAASLGATRTPDNSELAHARGLFLLTCRAMQVNTQQLHEAL